MKLILLLLSLILIYSHDLKINLYPISVPSNDLSKRIDLIHQRRDIYQTYYGIIKLGNFQNNSSAQYFKVLFDTGSCDFWIPNSKCKSLACDFKQKYERTSSLYDIGMAEFSIQYRDGLIEGNLARETVYLTEDLILNDQTVGFANTINFPLLMKSEFDGILGLAYPNKIAFEKNIVPVFDNLINKKLLINRGLQNIFSIHVHDNGGTLSFGYYDINLQAKINDIIVWVPLAERNYWTFFVVDVFKVDRFSNVEGIRQQKQCSHGCKGVIDTGSFFIYGPAAVINNIIGDISLGDCSNKDLLPDIIFHIAAFSNNLLKKRVVELRLTPDDYLIENEMDCILGIKSDKDDLGFTFGWLFLKSFYTIFDRDNQRLGFVRSNKTPYMK